MVNKNAPNVAQNVLQMGGKMQTELEIEKDLEAFNKWRKAITKRLPNLTKRVFTLRKTGYFGCGFHWALEKDLGWIIHMANNYDKSYRDIGDQLVSRARYEVFIGRLEEIENSLKLRNLSWPRTRP